MQLQTLKKQKLDETKQQELISNALLETERLNMLIDNILLASSLESRDFIFKIEKENLSDLTRMLLERYYKNELMNGIIRLEASQTVMVAVDRTMYPSILTNLIDNALKYSPDVKKIVVTIEPKNNQVFLRVSDRGIGINEKDKSRIFDKFFRAGNEETRSTKGTGLGLYIVNYIVKKHKAQLRVSDNKPVGTIFEIAFNAA